MAINFLVAFRVAELASAPLRRISDATVRLAGNASILTSEARAANASILALGAASGAAIGAMSVSASQLEDALARLATATETNTGTIQGALDNAEASARAFSENFSTSAEEVIKAQFRLATAGVPVSEQIEATQGAFKLATATMGEFTVAAELLGSFLNTFGRTAELSFLSPTQKVAKITDIASSAVQKYQLDLDNLNDSLKFLVGPATTLGLPVAEVFGFAGALNTAGFRGTLAGTAISNAFNKIDKAVEELDLDVTAFTDAQGNLKSFGAFLDEVERSMSKMTSIERQSKAIQVFDIRAGRAINTLINMKASVAAFVAESEAAVGVTDRLAGIIESTTSAQFAQLGNVIQNTATYLGAQFNNSFKTMLPALKSAAQALRGFVGENAATISAIIGMVTVALTVSAVMITVGLVINQTTNALTLLAQTSVYARIAIAVLSGVLRTISVPAGLLAIAGAFYLLAPLVENIGIIFSSSATASQRFLAALAALSTGVLAFISATAGLRMLRFALGAQTVAQALTMLWGRLWPLTVLVASAATIWAVFTNSLESVSGSVGRALSGITALATGLLAFRSSFSPIIRITLAIISLTSAITTFASSSESFAVVTKAILGIAATVAAIVSVIAVFNQLGAAWTGVVALFSQGGRLGTIWNSIRAGATSALASITSFAQGARSAFNIITSGGFSARFTRIFAGLGLAALSLVTIYMSLQGVFNSSLPTWQRVALGILAVAAAITTLASLVSSLNIINSIIAQFARMGWQANALGRVLTGLSATLSIFVGSLSRAFAVISSASFIGRFTQIFQLLGAVIASVTAVYFSLSIAFDSTQSAWVRIGAAALALVSAFFALTTINRVLPIITQLITQFTAMRQGGTLLTRSLVGLRAVLTGLQRVLNSTAGFVVRFRAAFTQLAGAAAIAIAAYHGLSAAFDSSLPAVDRFISGLFGTISAIGSLALAWRPLRLIGTQLWRLVLMPIITAISGFLATITAPVWAVVAAVALIGAGLWYAFSGSDSAIEKATQSTVEFQREIGSAVDLTSKYAADLERLAKISAKDIEFKVKVDAVPGKEPELRKLANIPFAIDATNQMLDPINRGMLSAKQAIDNQLSPSVESITSRFLETADAAGNIQSSLDRVNLGRLGRDLFEMNKSFGNFQRIENDKLIDILPIEQLSIIFKDFSEGLVEGFKAAANGSQQAEEALRNVDAATRRVIENDPRAISVVFDTLNASATELAKSPVAAVSSLAKAFLDLKAGTENLSAGSDEFNNLIRGSETSVANLSSAIQKIGVGITPFAKLTKQINESDNKFKTSTGAVKRYFKEAELGQTDFTKAFDRGLKRLATAEQEFQNINRAIEESKKRIAGLSEEQLVEFRGSEAFKDLEKQIQSFEEKKIELQLELIETRDLLNANEILAKLNLGALGKGAVDALKRVVEASSSVIADALFNKDKAKNSLAGFTDVIKRDIVSSITQELGAKLTAPFAKEIDAATKAARDVIIKAELGGTLAESIRSGNLQAEIESAVAPVIPMLRAMGFGDLLGLSDAKDGIKELRDSLFGIYDQASVSIITATNESAAALAQMQTIISQPAMDMNQMQSQIDQLAVLLRNAHLNGAESAIGPIENAMQMIYAAMREQGGNTPADKFLTAAQQAEKSLGSVADKFNEAFDRAQTTLGSTFQPIIRALAEVSKLSANEGAFQQMRILADAQRQASAAGDIKAADTFGELLKVLFENMRTVQNPVVQQSQMRNVQFDNANRVAAEAARPAAEVAAPQAVPAGIAQTNQANTAATNLTQAASTASTSIALSSDAIATAIVNAGATLQTTLRTAATELTDSVRGLIPIATQINSALVAGIRDLFDNIRQTQAQSPAATNEAERGTIEVNISNEPQPIRVDIQQTVTGGTGTGFSSASLEEQDVRKIVDAATEALTKNMRETIRELEDRLRRR